MKDKQKRCATRAWLTHVLLALLAGSWMIVSEYVVSVSRPIEIAGVAGIVLVGGIVTSVVADKLSQHYRRSARVSKQRAIQRAQELDVLIEALPALFTVFTRLHRQRTASMYEFSMWLCWVYTTADTNLRGWVLSYGQDGQTKELTGLFPNATESESKRLHRRVATDLIGAWAQLRLLCMDVPLSALHESSPKKREETRRLQAVG